MEKQFGVLLAQFRRHKKSVEKEAGVSHLIEEGKARDIESIILLEMQKQRAGLFRLQDSALAMLTIAAEENRIRLLSLLSAVQWEKQHLKILRLRSPNTGDWLFRTDVFKEWMMETTSCCVHCHGIRESFVLLLLYCER